MRHLLLLSLLIASSAYGAELPHRFLTKSQVIALSVGAGMMTADLVSTKIALSRPGAHEANPLMQGSGQAVALKLGLFSASVGISYTLHRAHHDRAAKIVPILMGIPSMAAAIHNFGVK